MKIIHVVSKYPPSLGGAQSVVEILAILQKGSGHDVAVITSDQDWTADSYADPLPALPVHRLKSVSIAHTSIIFGLGGQLVRKVKRDDIVHVHVTQAYNPEVVWFASKIKHFSYIAHIHIDAGPSGTAGFLLKAYKPLVLRRVLRDAAQIVVPTEDYKALISSKYGIGARKISVVPNGTTHKIARQPKAAPALNRAVKLLFVGRISVQKNLPLMLAGIASFRQKYGGRIELTMIGEGDRLPEIRNRIRSLSLEDNVRLLPAMYGQELEREFTKADLFVLTSSEESFGLVLVEAMTKGLPIVAVGIPAVRNVVTHGTNGLLAKAHDVDIANKIHILATDKGMYEKISANNITRAAEFSWEKAITELNEIYEKISRK